MNPYIKNYVKSNLTYKTNNRILVNFFLFTLLLFPLHPYLVDYLRFPNFWRQLVCYLVFIVSLCIHIIDFRFIIKRDVLYSLTLFFLFLFINILGVFIGMLHNIPTPILQNAFLLGIGFLPMIVIFSLFNIKLDKYLQASYSMAIIVAIGAIIEKLLGVYLVGAKYQSLNNILSSDGVYRVGSVFGDALTLGPYLAVWFLYGVWLLGKIRESSIVKKLVVVVAQIVIFLGIIFSGVRSAYIIVVFGIVIFILFSLSSNFKKIDRNYIVSALVLVSLVAISVAVSPLAVKYAPETVVNFYNVQYVRLSNIFDTNADAGNAGRIDNYILVINKLSDNVVSSLTGIGYGLSTNYNPNLISRHIGGFSAENQYLKVLYEQGSIGFIIFILFVLTVINRARLISKEKGFLIIIMLSFLLHMLFVPTLNSPYLSFLFYSFCGIVLSVKRNKNAEYK